MMLLCLLTILHDNSQLVNADSSCLLSGEIKGMPVIGGSDIFTASSSSDYWNTKRGLKDDLID